MPELNFYQLDNANTDGLEGVQSRWIEQLREIPRSLVPGLETFRRSAMTAPSPRLCTTTSALSSILETRSWIFFI